MEKTLYVADTGRNGIRLRQSVTGVSEQEVLVCEHVSRRTDCAVRLACATRFSQSSAIHLGPFLGARQAVQDTRQEKEASPTQERVLRVGNVEELPENSFGLSELVGLHVLMQSPLESFFL